jgi:hypothetical protein
MVFIACFIALVIATACSTGRNLDFPEQVAGSAGMTAKDIPGTGGYLQTGGSGGSGGSPQSGGTAGTNTGGIVETPTNTGGVAEATGGVAEAPTATGGSDMGGTGGNTSDGGEELVEIGGTGGTGGTETIEVNLDECKRGVAYGYHSEADMRAYDSNVVWWYNWSLRPDSGVSNGVYRDLGVEYVPMVWGEPGDPDDIANEIPADVKFLLGFNEPNFFEQADMSAQRAAELWPQVEQVADQLGLTLVSPAVNYCGGGCHDTDPFNYLDDFFAACQNCRVDHIAIHIYTGCEADWLIEHVEIYKERFSQPIWLTEFACTDGSEEDQIEFMRGSVEYLENEPRIHRYAWFSYSPDNINYAELLSGDGQLTALGQAYVDMPHNSQCDL